MFPFLLCCAEIEKCSVTPFHLRIKKSEWVLSGVAVARWKEFPLELFQQSLVAITALLPPSSAPPSSEDPRTFSRENMAATIPPADLMRSMYDYSEAFQVQVRVAQFWRVYVFGWASIQSVVSGMGGKNFEILNEYV